MRAGSIIGAVFGAVFRVAVAIFAVYAVYNGAIICYDYGYRIFTEPAVSSGAGRVVKVAVTEGMSPLDIGKLFENKGLVRDAKLFTLQYYLSEYRKDVKPGVFDLSTAMTAEEMMAVMAGENEDGTEDSEQSKESGGAAGSRESGSDDQEAADDQESGSEDGQDEGTAE